MIPRKLTDVIQSQLNRGKAILLVGPRQVGKTTLLKSLVGTLSTPALMLNCDEPETKTLLTSTNTSKLKLLIGSHRIVVIDEAQKVDNIGLTLKLIVDNFEGVQVIATGSSAFELHNRLNEPLTGRKMEYTLYPISTAELIEGYGLPEASKTLETRLIYGNYPDIVSHPEQAREYLTELSQSYLYKDILSMGDIRKPAVLERLLQALAFQVGSEVSSNELSHTLEIDSKTIEHYIDLLQKCYVIYTLGGLSRNLRTELKKSRKIYFYDNGIRNAIIQQFAPAKLRNDMEALWENYFITERMKRNHYARHLCNCYFWRTTQQQEIDFVEEQDGQMRIYEMKWNPSKKASFPKTFLNAYPVSQQAVVTPANYLDFVL